MQRCNVCMCRLRNFQAYLATCGTYAAILVHGHAWPSGRGLVRSGAQGIRYDLWLEVPVLPDKVVLGLWLNCRDLCATRIGWFVLWVGVGNCIRSRLRTGRQFRHYSGALADHAVGIAGRSPPPDDRFFVQLFVTRSFVTHI